MSMKTAFEAVQEMESTGVLWRDKGLPKGWLHNWVGMARRRKQNPETRFVESLLLVYLCIWKLSLIDAQKTAPAAIRA